MPIRVFWISIFFIPFFTDCAPVCDEAYSYVEVPENSPVGTVVKEITCSRASSSTGEITYAIKDGNTNGKFGVKTTNGIGKVFIFQSISFEARKTNFQLSIEVSENKPLRTSTTYVLDIQVTGVNDYAPLFLFSPYTVYVNEDIKPGTIVSNPIPHDFDKGDDGRTSSSILDGDDTLFYMDPTTAKVYLRAPLDYERNPDYSLVIQITDYGTSERRSSTTELNVHVKDVNDNPPTCEESYITKIFPESKPAGEAVTFLKCSDMDTGNNARLSYTIAQGDYTKFRLQGASLILAKQIDVDTEPNVWPLSILVRDRGTPRLSATVNVVVYVEGVDDNIPVWAAPQYGNYRVDIEEHSPVGTLIVRVSADDFDKSDKLETQDSTVIYYMDDYNLLFTVKPTTGDIFLNRPIDREVGTSYTIPVSAVSHNNPLNRISTHVVVNVIDINDNTPTFAKDVYQIFVAEDHGKNQAIATVEATDQDEGENGDVQHRIIGGDPNSMFAIAIATGEITLMGTLDYETITTHMIFIQASDKGHPRRWSTCTVIVSVNPVNEFEPIFEDIGTVDVSEDTEVGKSVFSVRASDDDKGNDGQLTFSVQDYNLNFVVESRTGVVRLLKPLDRETQSAMSVVLQAIDSSTTNQKSSSVTVSINVVDRNDNYPVCQMFYTVTLSPPIRSGDVVQTLSCSDEDIDANGSLSFSIVKGNTNSDFSVSSKGELIVLRKPTSPEYRIEIEAYDNGTPSLSAWMIVTIKTGSKPVFKNLPRVISISESASIGTPIFQVNALSISGQLEYSILNVYINDNETTSFGIPFLTIDAFTGQLFTWHEIDRERVNKYRVEVGVLDKVSNLQGKQNLEINVIDVNDHAPQFKQHLYNVSVVENVTSGKTLLQVAANDLDLNENGIIDYSIQSGNDGSVFAVDNSGNVVINSNIDRERTAMFELVITAKDRGRKIQLTGSTTVLVAVIDTDEYSPEFVNVGHDIETHLSEATPLGTKVFAMKATDRDINSQLKYSLDGFSKSHFIIDSSTGEIFLAEVLDRETKDSHTVVVIAEDNGGRLVSATVTLLVTDVNDNEPEFNMNVFSFKLHEHSIIGTEVGIFDVDDKDINDNGRVSTTITKGNIGSTFTISDNKLLLSGNLKFEMINEYILQIEANDYGTPARTTTASVIIQITPEHHIPKFAVDFQLIHIPENTHIGVTVYDMDATVQGAREGHGGNIMYAIETGNDNGIFAINRQTGEISVARKLDRDYDQAVFVLTVIARNIFEPNIKAETSLKIINDDINDIAPKFEKLNYEYLIKEDVSIHTVIDRLTANDSDAGDNAVVSYAVVSNPNVDVFGINSFTGEVYVKRKLDYFYVSNYQFNVIAYDHGSPSLTGTANIKVNVIDINDKTPTFESEVTELRVRENTAIGRTVYQVRATDGDTGLGGHIVYMIESGNSEGVFELGSENGQLVISKSLDREMTEEYTFVIHAEDKASPSLTGTTTLSIIVADVNDNPPKFDQTQYSVSLSRFSPIETHVISLVATDPDFDKNAEIEYSLLSEHAELFQIDSESGQLLTFADLSFYDKNSAKVVVIGKDKGRPVLSSSVIVEISLHPPVTKEEEDFNFDVSEYTSPNTFIGSLGLDSNIKYSIISGNFKNSFRITEDGSIFVRYVLDREEYPVYFLRVKTVHLQSSSVQSDINVRINVTDENDNAPVFEQEVYFLEVLEHTPIGYSLATITASDPDIGSNSNVMYSIVNTDEDNAHDLFTINDNGIIIVKKQVFFQTSMLNFTIIAKDNGQFSRHGSTQVDVTIIDVKEGLFGKACSGDSRLISLEIPVTAQLGHVVTTLTPQMFGLNVTKSKIGYVSYTPDSIFKVAMDTGDITFSRMAYLHDHVSYLLTIVAEVKDSAKSRVSRASLAMVRIDTMTPNKHVVILTHSVPKDIVELNKYVFLQQLHKLFPEGRPVIWKIEDVQRRRLRRRLLQLGDSSESYIYVIRENRTDQLGGIESTKRFVVQDELIHVLGTDDGGVSERLTTENFDSFPVIAVKRFNGPDKLEKAWVLTTLGKVLLGSCLAAVVFIIIVCVVLHTPDGTNSKLKKDRNLVSKNVPPTATQIEPKYNNIKNTPSVDSLPLMNALKILSCMSEEEQQQLIKNTFSRKHDTYQTTILNMNKWKTSPDMKTPKNVNRKDQSIDRATRKVSNENQKVPVKLFRATNTSTPPDDTQLSSARYKPSNDHYSGPTSVTYDDESREKPNGKLSQTVVDIPDEDDSVSSLELNDNDTKDETASESKGIVNTPSANVLYDDTSPNRPTTRGTNRPIVIGGKEYDGVGKDTATNGKYLYNTRTGDKLHGTDDILKKAVEHRQSVINSEFNADRRVAKLSTFKKPVRRKTSHTRYSTTTIWEMNVDKNKENDGKADKDSDKVEHDNKDEVLPQPSDVGDSNSDDVKKRRKGIDNTTKTVSNPVSLFSEVKQHSKLSDITEVDSSKANTFVDEEIDSPDEPESKDSEDEYDFSSNEMDGDLELKRRLSANASWDKVLSGAVTASNTAAEANDDTNDDSDAADVVIFKTMPAILEKSDDSEDSDKRWSKAKKVIKFVRPVYRPMNLEHVKCKVPKGKSDQKDCLSKDPVYAGWAKMVGRRLKSKVIKKAGESPRTVTVRQGRSLPVGLTMSSSPYAAKAQDKKVLPHLNAKRMSIDINLQ